MFRAKIVINNDCKGEPRMNSKDSAKKNRKIIGILFIILGVIGLILPVMPGWLFIAAGLAMM